MAEEDQFESVEATATDESEFSGVIFNNVRDCYPPNQDIECRYTIKPSVKPTRRDWVGLFKVGWHSSKEYSTYEWSPLPDFDGRVPLANRVLFRGSYLPNADDEFYQFCYVTNAGEIRGASVPFQIKTKAADLDLVCYEVEDEDICTSILLVNTKTAVLEDSLSRSLEENKALKATNESYKADLVVADEKIMDLETVKADLTAQLNNNKEILASAKKEVESVKKALSQKTEELQEEKNRRIETETRLAEEQTRGKDLATMLDNANLKVQELSNMLEKERSESSEAMKNREKLVTEKVQYLESITADREMLQKFRVNLKAKDEEVNSLKARLSETRAKAKAEVGSLSSSLDKTNERVTTIQEELAKERSTCDNLRRSTEMEIDQQMKKVWSLQNELRSKEQELGEGRAARDEQACQFSELQQTIKETQDKSKKEFSAMSRVLKSNQEESNAKQECIHRLEDELQEMQQQLAAMKDKSTALEEDYESTMRALEDQLEGQKALNESLCCHSDNNLVHLQSQLQRQLEVNKDLGYQLEAKTIEAKQLHEGLEACKKELHANEAKIQCAWIQLSTADAEARDLKTEREVLQTKLSDNSQERAKHSKNSEASMFALKTAQTHLEKKLLESNKEKENLWRERNDLKRTLVTFQGNLPAEDLRHQIEDLRAHNEDLRVRLNMGAEAYKMKFIECRRLQSQLKKSQKSSSTESVHTSMNADVQSVVSKLRQALDSERELVTSTRSALEREKEAAWQRDLKLIKLQEENFHLKERIDLVTLNQVQQSASGSLQAVEELRVTVENLQTELVKRGAELVEIERDLQTEKCEKETINHEIKNLKEQLRGSHIKWEEEHHALVIEQTKIKSLEELARQMMQDRFDSEEELKDRIRKLGEEVERWKKEVDMHVDAEAKLIGASSPEQQRTIQDAAPQPQPQSPPPQPGSPPQNHNPFQGLMRRFGPSNPPPWTPWIMVNQPTDQEGHPPPEVPPAGMWQPPVQPAPGTAPWMTGAERECPFCKVLFPPSDNITHFEEHVELHFRDR